MAAHEHLGEQFDYPYPRLREAYARNWANHWGNAMSNEGQPFVDNRMFLPTGREQARRMVSMYLAHPEDKLFKDVLMEQGFRYRNEANQKYSTWYN